MERDCEITFKNLTAAEVKTLADCFMSMRLHPTDSVVDAVNYSAPPRDARTGQVAAPPPPPPPFTDAAPPVVGNVVPPPPPPPVHAPVAAPSSQAPAATASGPVDSRGVPFHIDHHSGTAAEPGINDKGAFKKRRGHDPKALEAYEAQYLGKSGAAAGQAAMPPQTPGTAPQTTGASGGAPLPPPPPPGTPGLQDFHHLWLTLVNGGQANPALENYMAATYGGHPVHSDAYNDPAKRLEAYQFLKRYLPQTA